MQYDPAISLKLNLVNFGFRNRPPQKRTSDNHGRQEIYDAETGQVFGTMDYWEAADMLQRLSK